MKNTRIIIVANRIPFRIAEKKGKLVFTQSAGGLVSAIKSYIEKIKSENKNNAPVFLWAGTSDISEKQWEATSGKKTIVHDDFQLHPVFLPAKIQERYYNHFCNNTLWPLFHYFPQYAKFSTDDYEAYKEANHLFCNSISEIYQPGDILWIHDYHHLLLPAFLREKFPDATMGFFLHIPFPSFELFRLLPCRWRKELLEGMSGADLIGFHTHDYVQHFLKSVRQILGWDNTLRAIVSPKRMLSTDAFPISIDHRKFRAAINEHEVFAERNKIKKKLNERKFIISVSRLDYTKGIINCLEGFELLLEKFLQWKNKVVYNLVMVPSREAIPHYKENKKEIEETVSRINGKYGNMDWTPVIYQYKSLDFIRLTALYLAADAALVTPLRDGMNLVAKEFIATRSDKRGALILSETAGAAAEFGEAILVNPTDRSEIAEAIHQSLTMLPEEQETRMEIMQKRIRHYDVVKWAEDFFSQLQETRAMQETFKVKEVSKKTEDTIIAKYLAARHRIIFLDYDGTLTPLARFPELAVPTVELKTLIARLAGDEKNTMVLISGRKKETLEEWFGEPSVNLASEHGAFFRKTGEDWTPTIQVNPEWKSSVMPLMNIFTERCAGTFVEEKTFSLVWHYRNAEKELAFLRSRELVNALMELSSHLDFQVMEGNKVIEAHTRGIDKGMVASSWLGNGNYDFILAIGDDRTDEDLFRVIPPEGYSIRVGLTQSAANYNFKQQKDVIDFLNKLCEAEISNAKMAD